MSAIAWNEIHAALYAWINDYLNVSEVIWENENAEQPAYPFISLLVSSGPSKEGGIDELRCAFDAGAPAGEEIALTACGPREFTLSITAHVDCAEGATTPDMNAIALLSDLQASLGLPTTLDALSTAGLSIIEELPVVDSSVVISGEWISKATFDVRMRAASALTQKVGYIDKVEMESTELGIDPFLVDAS